MPYAVGRVLHADFYARVENGCRNVEQFEMDSLELLSIIRMTILRDFTAAQSALAAYYRSIVPMAVGNSASFAGMRAVSLASVNWMNILNIAASPVQPYLEAQNFTHLLKVGATTSHEHRMSRYFYTNLGDGEILIFNGAELTPDTTVYVQVVRYPDYNAITRTSIEGTTERMDLPDWFVGFEVLSCIVQAVKEKGLTPPQALLQQVEGAISAMSDRLAADEARALQLSQDTVTR